MATTRHLLGHVKGDKGDTGDRGLTGPGATITVGTVTTGAAGTPASVTNSGTGQAATFNFTIPQGVAGTGTGGITEEEAITAVRQAQPVFMPATGGDNQSPAITLDPAPLGAGWAVESGSGSSATWRHTAGNTVPLAFRITDGAVNSGVYLVRLTSVTGAGTTTPTRVTLAWATSATDTAGTVIRSNMFFGYQGIFTAPSSGSISHLVIIPGTDFTGTVGGGVTLNRFTHENQVVTTLGAHTVRARSNYRLFIGANNSGQYCGNGPPNYGYGDYCMDVATGSGYNSAYGYYTLRKFQATYSGGDFDQGGCNSAFGNECLKENVWGGGNSAFGFRTLQDNVNGSRNTGCGTGALAHNLLGSQNTALGMNAGRYRGSATNSLIRADRGVFIGFNARASDENQTNEIVIGNEAVGGGSNTITLGNDEITELRCNVQTISTLSDPRVKDDVEPADLEICLDAVKSLPVHRWEWTDLAGVRRDRHVTGFLSDEVARVFPKAVTVADEYLVRRDADGNPVMTTVTEMMPTWNEENPEEPILAEQTREIQEMVLVDGLQRVTLTEIVPTLWGAVQKLIEKNESLERQIAALGGTPAAAPTTPPTTIRPRPPHRRRS